MRSYRLQAMGAELLAVPACGAGLEADMVAFELVLAGEGFQEGDASAKLRQSGQAALQFACRQVVQHIRANQQVDRRAGTQLGEVAEVRVVQIAPRAVFRD